MKNIMTIALLFVALLTTQLTHAKNTASNTDKILIVLTSHTELGNTGKKTGFWLPELTHPYYEFTEAGYTVDVASISGGMAPVDSKAFKEEDEYHEVFLNDAVLMAKVIRSIPLAEVNPEDYRAIMFAGGSGPMWDFPNNPDISRISAAIYDNQGIVSAVCHGNAALVNLTLSNGELLVKGKRVSAFTNEEEASLGTTEIVPFLLQDKLVERGAIHVPGKAWAENVVVDGRLVTGQNPASAKEAAQRIIAMIKKN
jgi:putative intracellular protease/amidase